MTNMDAILDDAFAAAGVRPGPPRKAVARFSKPLEIHGAAWREQVKHRLIDGYGVEDIALWLGCHISHVQAEVSRLRRRGDLARWWGGA